MTDALLEAEAERGLHVLFLHGQDLLALRRSRVEIVERVLGQGAPARVDESRHQIFEVAVVDDTDAVLGLDQQGARVVDPRARHRRRPRWQPRTPPGRYPSS